MTTSSARTPVFFAFDLAVGAAEEVGFRIGAKGAHTSRTMMLAELRATLDAVPTFALERADNCFRHSSTDCDCEVCAAPKMQILLTSQSSSRVVGDAEF